MGPYYESDGAVNMGTACHIYSAAAEGPRGQGGKDKAFLESEANGIWCCAYHGTLIDKKKAKIILRLNSLRGRGLQKPERSNR